MSFISQETIEAVNSQADIVSIIGEYTKLESKGGSSYMGCCPFHHEKTPSFSVSADKKLYHCFGCGVGGNIFKFIMEEEKLGFSEAVEFLAKKLSIPVKYNSSGNKSEEKSDSKYKLIQDYIELYERVSTSFHYFLLETEQGKQALQYITKRGLSLETIKKFKLGYSPADKFWLKKFLRGRNFSEEFLKKSELFSEKYPDCSFFTNRLMFPIFNKDSKVIAFGGRLLDPDAKTAKYINTRDAIHYKKGENLYGFNFAKKAVRENNKIILCEGYMDCIAWHQCGIEYAVAPLGTALTKEQIRLFKPFCEEVLLAMDSDGAGQKATYKDILALRREGFTVKVIILQGGKDPAEIMLKFGPETLTNAISGAILDSDFLLSKLGELYPVDTPEGKTKAAQAFFPYVDALQSVMQKESSLELLSRTFNIRLEAVRQDFQNRNRMQYNPNYKPVVQTEEKKVIPAVKMNAELRSVLALVCDLDKFRIMRNELSADDFEDYYARKLYEILEVCFSENSLSLNSLLNHCTDEQISSLITDVVTKGEFSGYTEKAVRDSIKLIKTKSLERQRDKIMNIIRTFRPITQDDKDYLGKLLSEKMELDKKIRQ
ncbi:MAG: DNA primase [Treponema sp.]|nr:DNA primase [Treponema sp.]